MEGHPPLSRVLVKSWCKDFKKQRCAKSFLGSDRRCSIEQLENGNPTQMQVAPKGVGSFVSTYWLSWWFLDYLLTYIAVWICCPRRTACTRLLLLDLAEQQCLDRDRGISLLAGITWSIKTFAMTQPFGNFCTESR